MPRIETNDFPITNLSALSSRYRLYRIKGLNREHSEYYANRQHIIRKLSYLLQKPVTVIEREDAAHLVVRDDVVAMPSSLPVVRTVVYFEPCSGVFDLDYTLRSPQNDEICLRFLQFMLQEPLGSHPNLWQPGTGKPFFKKSPVYSTGDICQYLGFAVRAVVTDDRGLALRVSIRSKFLSHDLLPTHISRDEFGRWKGHRAIYRFGHKWYEIRIDGLSDLNATEFQVPKNGSFLQILSYVVDQSRKPIPPELAQVPHDASVLTYHTNKGEERGAIAALCCQVHGAYDEGMEELHERSIMPPLHRRSLATEFAERYLRRLRFGDSQLCVDANPISVPRRMFVMPDFKFGHSKVLSVRGTAGAEAVRLERLGPRRLELLRDKKAGFYDTDPLGRQYFILPQSVQESFGEILLRQLGRSVDELFPQEHGYVPIVVAYNDRGPLTLPYQGNAILKAVREQCHKPGHALVMIHHLPKRKVRDEDELAAMVVRELRNIELVGSVMHSTMGRECYVLGSNHRGDPEFVPHSRKRGKLFGYLRQVALNKILLANQRWPFVLATPLHADVTIGIDVKHHTAGLVLINKTGEKIRWFPKTSTQKEQLRTDQLESYLIELIRDEALANKDPIRVIVIHRDGRMWPSEIKAAHAAVEYLRRAGTIDSGATVTILEFPKSSPSPLRLFDISERYGKEWIENPQIGLYHISGDDGYVCTTGRAFPKPGTVEPFHVRRIDGPLPLEQCLEDVFFLSALAMTKPDDCARDPITIKLNDRFLGEEATEYDSAALDYQAARQDLDEEAIA